MKDISYHILDIVQNSLQAGATHVVIRINEQNINGLYEVIIRDNGKGIANTEIARVTDPFYTTGKNKRFGLGLPLLKQNAEQTGGYLQIKSVTGQKTTVKAIFRLNHIDCLPEGDIALTLRTLIAGFPDVDFVYEHQINQKKWKLSTAEMKKELYPVPVNTVEVLDFITQNIHGALAEMRQKT